MRYVFCRILLCSSEMELCALRHRICIVLLCNLTFLTDILACCVRAGCCSAVLAMRADAPSICIIFVTAACCGVFRESIIVQNRITQTARYLCILCMHLAHNNTIECLPCVVVLAKRNAAAAAPPPPSAEQQRNKRSFSSLCLVVVVVTIWRIVWRGEAAFAHFIQ